MKNILKKISPFFALIMAFAMCFPLVGCGCDHDWKEISNTATCLEKGIKTLECSKCQETKTEPSPIAEHSFDGTKCDVCKLVVTSTWSPKSNCTKCSNVNMIGDNKSYFQKLHTTATCMEDGVAYYKCGKCYEKFFVLERALGHSLNKNICERCGNALKDLSEFPETYRMEISDKLEHIAPYTIDSETFVTATRLFKLCKDDITDCESRVEKAQRALENAKNEATVRRYVEGVGWVWQADEKKVAAAEEDLESAQKSLRQAQDDLDVCKVSYEFNCEGYAWNIAILGIKATDANNYAINYNLASLAALEMSTLDITDMPSWYKDIISNIQTLTGLDIRQNSNSAIPD